MPKSTLGAGERLVLQDRETTGFFKAFDRDTAKHHHNALWTGSLHDAKKYTDLDQLHNDMVYIAYNWGARARVLGEEPMLRVLVVKQEKWKVKAAFNVTEPTS